MDAWTVFAVILLVVNVILVTALALIVKALLWVRKINKLAQHADQCLDEFEAAISNHDPTDIADADLAARKAVDTVREANVRHKHFVAFPVHLILTSHDNLRRLWDRYAELRKNAGTHT